LQPTDRPAGADGVVITGLGATTPLGADVPTTWAALLANRSGVRPLTDSWAANFPVRIAATLHDEPTGVLSRVEMRRLDRSQQVALVAAREAWRDADTPELEPERLAVVIGTGIGGAITMLAQDDVYEKHGPGALSPRTIPMLMPNAAAAAVSIELGARGGAYAPVSACASGAEALAAGWRLIQSGRADVVLAGGTEACIHPLCVGGFARMGALSIRNDHPAEASRPFDIDRDGFVLGEGAATLVLERAAFARARGARVYATLAAAEVTSDAYSITASRVEGQTSTIRAALRASGLAPADIVHVNAHATGTPAGDGVEAAAITTELGTHPLVTAAKSLTGHLLGAAGALEAIFTTLSVQNGVIPATANLEKPDQSVDFEIVVDTHRAVKIPAAISNSFGFGGHNVVLVFRQGS
jgi:3-oxoacyl-[acyl-carrier-protein] synthase II